MKPCKLSATRRRVEKMRIGRRRHQEIINFSPRRRKQIKKTENINGKKKNIPCFVDKIYESLRGKKGGNEPNSCLTVFDSVYENICLCFARSYFFRRGWIIFCYHQRAMTSVRYHHWKRIKMTDGGFIRNGNHPTSSNTCENTCNAE